MILRKTVDFIKKIREPLRVFSLVGFFLLALDSCIAVNRWWFGPYTLSFWSYVGNLISMVLGFTFFTILASRSKLEAVGYVFFCVAIYFICNYEIGGPSKYYLTPFDPLFGLPRTFAPGDPGSYIYRKTMAYITSILGALFLAFSRLKHAKEIAEAIATPIGTSRVYRDPAVRRVSSVILSKTTTDDTQC